MKTSWNILRIALLASTLAMSTSATPALVSTGVLLVYDDDRDITWLRDAGSRGRMTLAEAQAFATELNNGNFGGGTGWRLPTADLSGAGCTLSFGEGFGCTGSELGHVYYVELGNVAGGPLSNRGPFVDLQNDIYWTQTIDGQGDAFVFNFFNGFQTTSPVAATHYAWLVHGGRLTPPAAACEDGVDNDGDGRTDFPADPGCRSAADVDELDAPICAVARRVMTGEQPKALGLDFISAADPACRITTFSLSLGAGNSMSPHPGAISCVPNLSVWTNAGTATPMIGLNPQLAPGASYQQCVNDSFFFYLTAAQSASAAFTCPGGNGTVSGPFDHSYDVTTYKTFKYSEAMLGTCANDLCAELPGLQTADSDGDGIGDACDNCPLLGNAAQTDTDGDGIGDGCDNCVSTANSGQADANGDGVGDACESAATGCLLSIPVRPYLGIYRSLTDIRKVRRSGIYAEHEASIAKVKVGVLRAVNCLRPLPELPAGLPYCLKGPITFGIPERCPGLDCRIDGPGCMDPYQFARGYVPDIAVHAVAEWATGTITDSALTSRLLALSEAGQITLGRERAQERYLPRMRLWVGVLAGIGLVALGLLIGRSAAKT